MRSRLTQLFLNAIKHKAMNTRTLYRLSTVMSFRVRIEQPTLLKTFMKENKNLYRLYLQYTGIRSGGFREPYLCQALHELIADVRSRYENPCLLIAAAGIAMKVTILKRLLYREKGALSPEECEERLVETYRESLDYATQWLLTQKRSRSFLGLIRGVKSEVLYTGQKEMIRTDLRRITLYYCHESYEC